MGCVDLTVTPSSAPLPTAVTALLGDASARVDRFLADRGSERHPAFVPCDFEAVARTLVALDGAHLAPGPLFCEWGSGFGVVAMVAALLGFDACGIEVEGELVRAARALAADRGIPVRFVEGSFVPDALADLAGDLEEFAWLRTDAPSAYDELGHDPDELDVVFAYPWPGEEAVVEEVFDRVAADGALFVTWHGRDGARVRRRRARTRRARRR